MKTYLSMPSRLRRFPLNRSFPKFALSFCTADGKWPPRFAGSATCRTTPACGRALRTTHPMYRSDRPHSHAHGASESPSGQACQQLVDGSKSSAFHGLRIDAAYTNGGGDDGGEAQAASRTSLASTPSLGQISVARSESPLAGSSGAAGNGRPDHRRDASLSPPLPRSLPRSLARSLPPLPRSFPPIHPPSPSPPPPLSQPPFLLGCSFDCARQSRKSIPILHLLPSSLLYFIFTTSPFLFGQRPSPSCQGTQGRIPSLFSGAVLQLCPSRFHSVR